MPGTGHSFSTHSLLVPCMAAALLCGGSAPSPPAPPVVYRLSPLIENGQLTALNVSVQYLADSSGRGDFEWIRSWAGEDRPWRWARAFKVEGATKVEDEGDGRWRISAAPGEPLTVSYRIASAFNHDPSVDDDVGQALPIIRPGWFYGVGETLFGVPANRDDAPAAFAWSGAPAGLAFASDLQHLKNPDADPASVQPRPGTVADIQESISLGGTDLQVSGALTGPSRVRIASRGAYKFSSAEFDSLARRIIDTERAFWRDGQNAPFLITLAPLAAHLPYSSLSGTGRTDAFALWYDEGASLESAKGLLAHEYFHTWDPRQLGGLDKDPQKEALGYWFSEGFTDYYTRRLTLATGVWSLQDFADAWNGALKSYDLSAGRLKPNRAIPAAFWSDPALRQLPYWRGSLIAAVLDAKLRAGDPEGLDRLLRDQRRIAAHPKDSGRDAAMLFRTILRARRPDLDAWVGRVVVDGAPVALPADTFAPCFRVTSTSEPTFDRGFDLTGTSKNGYRVVGLEPGGPAARAGLHDGDRISVDESTVPDPSVRRRYVVHDADGSTHVVEYLPQGPLARVQRLTVSPKLGPREQQSCVRLYGARG